jgi:hypothetical protein
MTLAVPITVAFIVALLILEFSPMVSLTGSDWLRIGLMYLASLIFISAMYNFGLLFSCLTKKSAVSLILVLFFWAIFVVIIPNGSVRLATQVRPLEPREVIDGQIMALGERLASESRDIAFRLYQEGDRSAPGRVVSHDTGAFGRGYAKVVSKNYVGERMERQRQSFPLAIEYADKIWEVEFGYLSGLLRQKQLADNLSRTSPISLYDNALLALAGTDLDSFQYFVDGAKTYRNDVIDYIRSRTDNFSLPSLITRCTEEDMLECQRRYAPVSLARERGDDAELEKAQDAWRKWADETAAAQSSLDLRDLPRFTYRPSVLRSFRGAILDLGLLMFVSILFFALSFVAFVRYDVRSD